jgi:hypothetical protein
LVKKLSIRRHIFSFLAQIKVKKFPGHSLQPAPGLKKNNTLFPGYNRGYWTLKPPALSFLENSVYCFKYSPRQIFQCPALDNIEDVGGIKVQHLLLEIQPIA